MPISLKPPLGRGYRIRFTPPPPPATPPPPMRSILKVNLAPKNNRGGCDEESNSSNGTAPTCASSREGLLVHFSKSRDNDDEHAQLTVDIAVIPNRKDLDGDQLYYNRYEIKKMRTEAHARAATFLPSKKRLLQETYESLPLGKNTKMTASTTTAFQAHKALACLYQQSDRGLERFILPELPEKRQDTVRRIVRVQHQDSHADHDEHLIRLLRMRSLLLSRKALQFALCLGAADAWEVEQHR